MDGYIFDTNVLSPLLNSAHIRHGDVEKEVARLDSEWPNFISAVSLAELEFGAEMAGKRSKAGVPDLQRIVRKARRYPVLRVTEHTAAAYAVLKSNLAMKYLAKPSRRDRPRWLEDWVDKASGKTLGVDENDLWICAHARERGLVVVTADRGMQRIADADAAVRLRLIP